MEDNPLDFVEITQPTSYEVMAAEIEGRGFVVMLTITIPSQKLSLQTIMTADEADNMARLLEQATESIWTEESTR